MEFYFCPHCKNIIAFAESSGAEVVCCGEKMKKMVPNTVDAAVEKHIPTVRILKNKVTVIVGDVLHPMSPEHYIKWIALETVQGNQRKLLKPDSKPEAEFMLCDGDRVVSVFAYCNLHGLWKNK